MAWYLQVCSREDGEAALQSVKERVLQKGVAEDVAEQQLSTEVMACTSQCTYQGDPYLW